MLRMSSSTNGIQWTTVLFVKLYCKIACYAESFRTVQKFTHACVRGNPSKSIAWFCYGGGPCGRHEGGRVGRHGGGGQVGGVIPCHDFTLCYGVSPCHYVTQCYGVILFDMAMSCYAVSTFMVLTLYVVCPGHFI